MFKVGDEVVYNNKLFVVTGGSNLKGYKICRQSMTHVDIGGHRLKPRYEVKYVVLDHLSGANLYQLFDTEQKAFDYINKPRVNVGEHYKHSDGTIVRINSKEGDIIHTRHEACGENVLLSFTMETFLENFTKCK